MTPFPRVFIAFAEFHAHKLLPKPVERSLALFPKGRTDQERKDQDQNSSSLLGEATARRSHAVRALVYLLLALQGRLKHQPEGPTLPGILRGTLALAKHPGGAPTLSACLAIQAQRAVGVKAEPV